MSSSNTHGYLSFSFFFQAFIAALSTSRRIVLILPVFTDQQFYFLFLFFQKIINLSKLTKNFSDLSGKGFFFFFLIFDLSEEREYVLNPVIQIDFASKIQSETTAGQLSSYCMSDIELCSIATFFFLIFVDLFSSPSPLPLSSSPKQDTNLRFIF